jgi:hypothetical protein
MKKISCVVTGVLLVGSALHAGTGLTLESIKVDTVSSLDAGNTVWAKANPIEVVLDQLPYESEKYKGVKTSTAKIQSVYDSENVYFKIEYADPAKSLERYPWEKQPDGTWKQLKNPDRFGKENTYYEDRVALYWDISARGFERRGCAVACHMAENGKINGVDAGKTAGRKFTRAEGQFIDMWHAKGVRTDSVGQADDQFVNHYSDATVNRNWGRNGDEHTGGGYKDNINKEEKIPAFMSSKAQPDPFWIHDADKVPFVDTFESGDRLPAMVVSPRKGSRGDISLNSKWEDGVWTYVIKRALVTKHPKSADQDVQFSDLSKTYPFGVSVFDNTQINHVYHEGSISLSFK